MIEQLILNFLAVMGLMVALWVVAVAIRDVSFIDAVWAYGMVAVAALSMLHIWPAAGMQPPPLSLLLMGLTGLWGLRLGTHLLLRWRRLGRDPRYDRILGNAMDKKGWSFATSALLLVFLLQGPLLWFVSLPAQAGILAQTDRPIGPLAIVGAVVALIGILFETVADLQLEAFRKNPDNKGAVMDRGLWRYTRHPNYFGDACTWWGIWIVSASTGSGLFTILSPILLTWMLMKWSGAPLLEKGLTKTRPGYAEYVARTSGFVPRPPKRD